MDSNMGPDEMGLSEEEEELIHVTPIRAKRNKTRPKYLKDYVEQ
jgi:hypothetical protein